MNYLALSVFIIAYVLFFALPHRRWQVGVISVAFLVICGCYTPLSAFFAINWNVMGIFVGTLVLADLFMISRLPAVIAVRLVNISGTVTMAMLLICMFTSFLSAFVENVATVLIIAPIALSITHHLRISPVPVILSLAISSNLQGTATLIGDPPSMLLAGYTGMNFMDFFVYQSRLSVFWFVELGALASFGVLYFIFRKYNQPVIKEKVLKPHTIFPGILLVAFIVALMLASLPGSRLASLTPGGISMIFAVIGMLWYILLYERFQWHKLGRLALKLDWGTTIFLMCVFILVGSLTRTGWISVVADGLAGMTRGSVSVAYIMLVSLSVSISAFVDNVPYLATMLPVAQQIADSLGAPHPLLLFGLLIGSCLGGNITPLGASANIVAIGLLRRQGIHVSFWTFVKIGLPFTLVAVIVSALFLWFVWAP